MENRKQTFLGTGWSFPPTFSRVFYGVEMTADLEDIKRSLDILFSTKPMERVMQPRYGSNLIDFVYEPMNIATTTAMEKIIKDAVTLNEPRIIVDGVEFKFDNEEGKVVIDIINLRVISTNTRYNYVYPYYLVEATNLTR